MPTVQKYGTRRVGLEALPDVRRTAAETAASAGVGIHQAQADKMAAIGQFGSTLVGVSGAVQKIQQEERAKAADAEFLEADNATGKWLNNEMYHPETGALIRRGKDALGLPEEVGGRFTKRADEIAAGLKTPEAKAAYARLRARYALDTDSQLYRHVAGEMKSYYAQELKGVVENTIAHAVSNAHDPDMVDADLAKLTEAIRKGGPRTGLTPQGAEAMLAGVATETHVGVIKRLIAGGFDGKAKDYFLKNQEEITTGDARARMEAATKTASTEGTGLRTSIELWETMGPKSDEAPIEIDKMQAVAEARFKDEPDTLKATMEFLRAKKATADMGRADRREQNASDLWDQVAARAPLEQIMASEAYVNAPGALKVTVKRTVLAELEHAVEEREQAANRAYTTEARVESQKQKDTLALMWSYNNPTVLNQMTEPQIKELIPNIGIANTMHLLETKRAYAKSADVVRVATIDQDQFMNNAQSAGLKPFDTKADKAALSGLKNSVETLIAAEERLTGKAMPRERKDVLMQQVIDKKVMVDYWTGDQEKIAAMVVDPTERANAYVPIAKIRPATIAKALAEIRRIPGAEALGDDAALQVRFGTRIQRAYAIALMGGTEAEQKAILRGEAE